MPQAQQQVPKQDEPNWIDAGVGGYSVALHQGKILCRNAKGKLLASVPKKARETEMVGELRELRDWLVVHERECAETVDAWMTRSLPVPREVLLSVWPDPAWRRLLEDAVIWPLDKEGTADPDEAGFFKGVDAQRGVGVVNLDGETAWLDAGSVALPHPVLLEELDDFRELATELQLTQELSQLFRETHLPGDKLDLESTAVRDYAGGDFQMLTHATGRARKLGFRVSGGYAVCPVFEDALRVEARFWIGSDYPDMETTTDELIWVDEEQIALPIKNVGSVAFSEGMRMASMIYAGRVIKKEGEDD